MNIKNVGEFIIGLIMSGISAYVFILFMTGSLIYLDEPVFPIIITLVMSSLFMGTIVLLGIWYNICDIYEIEMEEKIIVRETDHLNNIIEAIKGSLNSKDSDYVTVFITVLIGEEEDVMEAEEIIDAIDRDDLPCKNAVIKLADWLDRSREDEE
jgi:hypothetical protein